MTDQKKQRYEIEEILAENLTLYDGVTTFCAGDFEWCAYQLMENGYRKQEWISVKDALPEDEQTVLTIDTEREMQVCFYETAQKGVFQLFHGLVSVYNITHWMPLPQPPKGE